MGTSGSAGVFSKLTGARSNDFRAVHLDFSAAAAAFCQLGPSVAILTAMECVCERSENRRLWVVDDAKKPIGVISLTDLINAVIDRMETVKVIGD